MARAIIEEMIVTKTDLTLNASFDSAIEAIKFLNNNAVDLIFLDIKMPTFNGFDFIQTIKNPPKIILTTSDKNFAFTAFEYGCVVDYLVKPITQDRFKTAVDKVRWFIQSPSLDDFINELKY